MSITIWNREGSGCVMYVSTMCVKGFICNKVEQKKEMNRKKKFALCFFKKRPTPRAQKKIFFLFFQTMFDGITKQIVRRVACNPFHTQVRIKLHLIHTHSFDSRMVQNVMVRK